MPYISKDNLLFIHVPKNAGKSIEVALGIATDETLNSLGRRSFLNSAATYLQRLTANSDAKLKLHGTLDVSLSAQHLTLQEITLLGLLDPQKLDSARKFAVFRNPFERALSTYKHFSGDYAPDSESFERFCKDWHSWSASEHNVRAHRRQQVDFFLTPTGDVGVDKILSFESISFDFGEMCTEWALNAGELERIGQQGALGQFEQIATKRARALIRDLFPDDVEFYEVFAKS